MLGLWLIVYLIYILFEGVLGLVSICNGGGGVLVMVIKKFWS